MRYKSEGRWFDPRWCHEYFIDINSSDRTMALGSTQPLTELSTRSIFWGKCGRGVRLTILPPSCAVVKKCGNLNFLEPCGPLQACNGTALLLPLYPRFTNPATLLPLTYNYNLSSSIQLSLTFTIFSIVTFHYTMTHRTLYHYALKFVPD
jgi:hypothetical protein